jgi:hypothetical protein
MVIVANSFCSWLSRQLWEPVNLPMFEKEYLYESFKEMNYVEGCGFHELLMLHCPMFYFYLSTFYGKIF